MSDPSRFKVGDIVLAEDVCLFGQELGRVTRTGVRGLMLFLALMFFAGAVIAIPLLIYNLATRAAFDDRFWVAVALIVGGSALGILFLFIRFVLGSKVWILTEQGILAQGNNDANVLLLWPQVRRIEVTHQSPPVVSDVLAQCSIAFVGEGEPLTFNNQAFGTDALSEILFIASERCAPDKEDWIQKIEQGESLALGPFTVSQAGLSWEAKSYPWSQIAGLSRSIFFLVLDLANGEQVRTGVSMLDLEDAGLLLALVRQFAEAEGTNHRRNA
jgi:hypothetical protein